MEVEWYLDLRLDFLKCLIEEWGKHIGAANLRKDPSCSLVGTASPDPTEESVVTLYDPVAMIVAQFGVVLPVASKFQVLGLP